MDWTYHTLGELVDYLDSIGYGPCPNRIRRKRRDNLRKKWRDSGLSKTDWFNKYLEEKNTLSGNSFDCIFVDDLVKVSSWNGFGHQTQLAPLPAPSAVACKPNVPVAKVAAVKKGNKMDYQVDRYGDTEAVSLAAKKLDYLSGRLNDVNYKKRQELEKLYGLVDDTRPTTLKEALQRIADGKISYDEKDFVKVAYGNPFGYLRWRDPSVKEDRDGYNKATDLLDKEDTKVRDLIQVGEPKDALAAIQALETWTPTGAPN